MKKSITLVLLGDIAAGKGTQSRILAKKFNLKFVGLGDFCRRMAKRNKRFERINKGIPAPSGEIQKFLKRELSKLSPHRSILIDGGRLPAEARLIHRILGEKNGRRILAIYLTIPQEESFRRAIGRFKRHKRGDDMPAVIRNRIKYYRKVYSKTVKFWQKLNMLQKISGLGPVTQVSKRIFKAIDSYYLT